MQLSLFKSSSLPEADDNVIPFNSGKNKLSFLDFLDDPVFAKMFDEIMLRAVMSIPSVCRGLENRMYMDYGIRRAFKEIGLCRVPLNKAWDLEYIFTDESISVKKQDVIFPRRKLTGTGHTVSKPLMIKNCHGAGRNPNKLYCDYDLLMAVQPPSKNNKYTIAVMRADKIPKLATRAKIGDQWLLTPKIKEWDHYREINCLVEGADSEKYNQMLVDAVDAAFTASYHDKNLKVKILD